MKKAEKLKSSIKLTNNQILLRELELRQVSGTSMSGFSPGGSQNRDISTNGGKDCAEMTETRTRWDTYTVVDFLSGETTPWIDAQLGKKIV